MLGSVKPSNLRWISYKVDKDAQIAPPRSFSHKPVDVYCTNETRLKQMFRYRRSLFKLGVSRDVKANSRKLSQAIPQMRSESVSNPNSYSFDLPSIGHSSIRRPPHNQSNELWGNKTFQERLPKIETTAAKPRMNKLNFRTPVVSKLYMSDAATGSLSPWKEGARPEDSSSPMLVSLADYQ